jgi:hypothetical protein
LSLSWDHLLPNDYPSRDNLDYIVTACFFCNVADNQYFSKASERGISFNGKKREDLIAQRKPFVLKTREAYRSFWETNVCDKGSASMDTKHQIE